MHGQRIGYVRVSSFDHRSSSPAGTASHYFAVPRDVSTRLRLDALHSAPGPNHFIQINGREYALQRIMIEVRMAPCVLKGRFWYAPDSYQ